MLPLRKLLDEVHGRSLWQITGLYLAGAWFALQVIDVLANSLPLPRWLPALAIVLVAAGLPIVLITAYVHGGVHRRRQRGASRGEDSPGSPASPAVEKSAAMEGAPPPPPSPAVEAAAFREAAHWGEEPPAGQAAVVAGTPPAPVTARLFTWRNAIAGGVLAFALWGVIAAAWLFVASSASARSAGLPDTELDRNLLAVLPFHAAVSSDLAYLGEGMVDLLAAKLSGESGLRAADPRAVISAWRRLAREREAEPTREEAEGVGRSLGAGRILVGGIVETPSGLVLNASVLEAGTGKVEARSSVEGPADSLTALVDRMAVELLARELGERDQRLAALTSTSLQAVRAYLDAQAAYRRGSYAQANQLFRIALEQDSTFALAALAWVSSGWWSPGFDEFNRALGTAWDLRERLSPRDQALLDAWAGPRYPQASGWAERLRLWELAIALAPERPEAWYESGDIYFHFASLLDAADALHQADARFRRAAQLDSTFSAPFGHLLELAAIRDEPETVRSLAGAYFALDSVGPTADYLRWRTASALGDREALATLRDRFPAMAAESLGRIMGLAQLYGPTLEDASLAASILASRVGAKVERQEWLLGLHSLALNRGRPREAQALAAELSEEEGSPGEALRLQVLDALYWEGDQEAAARAAEILARQLEAPPSPDPIVRDAQLADLCVAELWRLRRGDTSTAGRSAALLREPGEGAAPASAPPLRDAVCAASLEALLAMAEGRPDAGEAVDRLERLLLLVPEVENGDDPSLSAPFIVARWRESEGDVEQALAAMRRWHNHWLTGVRYLSSYLREEGRLAALAGERDEAIRAYRHYLMLRSDPDPALRPEAERVRSELAVLEAGR